MKKVTRISSILLAIAILLCYLPNASANNNNQSKSIIVQDQGHGQYTISNSKSLFSNKNTVEAFATEDEDIYYLKGDQYLLQVYENTYMLAHKIDFDYNDYTSSCLSLKERGASEKLIDEINKMIQQQQENGNQEFKISVFAPSKFVPKETLGEFSVKSGSSTFSSPVTSGTTYYTYNGYQMRAYWVKTQHASTGMKEIKGTSTMSKAVAFINMCISAPGVNSLFISLYGFGVSALQFYESMHGSVSYGTTSDSFTMNVIYDKIVKEDSIYFAGNWELGAHTYKVWLDRSDEYQYYANTGKSYSYSRTLNKEYFSENYNNAAQYASENFPSPLFDLPIKIDLPTGNYIL